jgi:two-component system, cell cycle sensor histidine kinase and response regulator CckA
VRSTTGKGTTIKILLPLCPEPSPSTPKGSSPVHQGNSRGRILVVDDEEAIRAVVSRMLQAEGYEVLRARDGTEALRELGEVGGAVDVVITDLVMPGMGGHVLGAELARRYPELPLVWMSGHPRDVEFPREMPGHEYPFLMKPVSPRALLEMVSRVLQNASDLEAESPR